MWGTLGAALRTGHPCSWGSAQCQELHTWEGSHLEAPQEVQMKQKQLVSSDASSPGSFLSSQPRWPLF